MDEVENPNGLMSVGGGPWRTLPDCPALTHNTVRAAKGVGWKSKRRPKCVCPYSKDLFAIAKERRRKYEQERTKRIHRAGKDPKLRLHPKEADAVQRCSPNFRQGVCTDPLNRAAAEKGMNEQPTPAGIAARAIAKALCEECPLKQVCRTWVLSEERPAGSWGGVWGGLDPWQRKGVELVVDDGRVKAVPYVHA